VLVAGQADAQPSTLMQKNIIFDQVHQKLGLTQASINCMLQDREGYLWIGTWSGLIRFDGTLPPYYYSSGLRERSKAIKYKLFTKMLKADYGSARTWAVFLYNRNDDTFIHYTHDPAKPESLSSNNISKMQEDQRWQLWVATEDGLNVFDGKQNRFRRSFSTVRTLID
jgi:ligand-binding sensor domain-containing protein